MVSKTVNKTEEELAGPLSSGEANDPRVRQVARFRPRTINAEELA